jgi:hypothetical protein
MDELLLWRQEDPFLIYDTFLWFLHTHSKPGKEKKNKLRL